MTSLTCPLAVSRETAAKLSVYVDELQRWQRSINLVSEKTLDDVWTRHIDDALQLHAFAPEARSWLDLGSGGGVPGLIVAAVAPDRRVTMIESDARKCAFLRQTARKMELNVVVLNCRIADADLPEDFVPEIVSARALAPLPALLSYAQRFFGPGTVGLFPKGRNANAELTEARESWTFQADVLPSRTGPDGCVLRLHDLARRHTMVAH